MNNGADDTDKTVANMPMVFDDVKECLNNGWSLDETHFFLNSHVNSKNWLSDEARTPTELLVVSAFKQNSQHLEHVSTGQFLFEEVTQ